MIDPSVGRMEKTMDLGNNLLYGNELALVLDGRANQWKRLLYLDDRGASVELLLTPSNVRSKRAWSRIADLQIRYARTFQTYDFKSPWSGDKMYRYVVRNDHSYVYRMLDRCLTTHSRNTILSHMLLHWDMLDQIDWERYTSNQSDNWCPFALCRYKR